MTPETSDMQAVLERLEKLERQNRRLKRAGVIACVLVVAWVAAGRVRPSRTLQAEEFRLTDGQGRVRASLTVNGDFTDLDLFSETRKGNASLSVSDAGGALRLAGPNDALADLDVEDSVGSGLHLHHSISWAGILATQDGANVTLSTPDIEKSKIVDLGRRTAYPVASGLGSATLGVDQDGTYVNLRDRGGFQAALGSTDLEVPRTGETRKTSAASLVMFAKDGKAIWRAP
jgi:hypothetical protein